MNRIKEKIRRLLAGSPMKAGITISSASISGNVVGGNLTISNGRVIVDGVEVSNIANVGPVTIIVEGSLERLELASGTVTVKGDVGDCQTVSGDIKVAGQIAGDCKTTSGDIEAMAIHGSCKTVSGDITGR